jgi:hypothetical protein
LEDALADQPRLEEFLAGDFKPIDQFIRSLDGKRGNRPITVEEARELTLQLRQAMRWNEVIAQETRMLLLLLFQLSLLVQRDPDVKIEDSENTGEFGKWVEQWKTATSAWNKYTE